MFETLVALTFAHLAADFVLQTDRLVTLKTKASGMALHIAIVVVLAALALGTLDPIMLGILGVTHLAMDAAKTHWMGKSLAAFIADQAVHLAVILGLAVYLPQTAAQGAWGALEAPQQLLYYGTLAVLSGLVLSMWVGGIVIGMLMDPLAVTFTNARKGIPNGGRYIGWLERGLTFTFFMIGHPEGVGFLLAAKSVLRFGDIQSSHEREHTEYVIIGTMLSFGWALVVAIGARAAAAHWLG
ncbi:DUF3307 domain-containing protein [Brevundimonas naejangsanensis]